MVRARGGDCPLRYLTEWAIILVILPYRFLVLPQTGPTPRIYPRLRV